MKTLIIGDVHGCWDDLNIVLARAFRDHDDIERVVQVGDLNYAWLIQGKPFTYIYKFWEDEHLEKMKSIPFNWLDGNHENHDQLDLDGGASQPGMIYQRRGSVVDFGEPFGRAMFFGGASSIDQADRTEHLSWWRQESIKYGQVRAALEEKHPINVIFSHDHPIAFPYKSWKDNFARSDRQALDALRDYFKPKWWFFGHHHKFGRGVTEGTSWVCVPIIESRQAVLWDGDDFELIGKEKRVY